MADINAVPIVIRTGIRMYKDTNLKKETWVEIKAPAWTRAQFSLPDGTVGWYNVGVEVNGSLADGFKLCATFIDESLEEILSLLKLTLSIDYIIENRDIKPDKTYAKKKVIITLRTI